MKLNVPSYQQIPWSADCGLLCIKMLLDYYGEKVDIEQLRNGIDIDETGIYFWEIGTYLLKKGFKVTLITRDPKLFSKKDFENPPKNFWEFFQNEKNFDLKTEDDFESFSYLKKFIEAWWKINIKVPDVNDIEKALLNDSLIISILTYKFLVHDTAKFDFHYNLVTGINQSEIMVNDPGSTHWGKLKYPINDFLYAVYATTYKWVGRGSFLLISK